MKAKVTTRKWMGDDAYSWAVFVNGRPVMTGLSRTEATYQKKAVTGIYAEREAK